MMGFVRGRRGEGVLKGGEGERGRGEKGCSGL